MLQSPPSYVTVHDQFCGAGGNSIAIEAEGGEVTRAWNHNEIAIETHAANFPKTEHECTDIFDVDPSRYEPATVLVTSPDCTEHTDAKGTKKPTTQLSMFEDDEPDPDAERSRMTMAQVVRFAKALKYEAVIAENVVQVLKWRYWNVWLKSMQDLGYNVQLMFFNSAFFAPTPQSRDRIYIVCTKKHLPKPDLRFTPKAYCGKCGCDVEAVQVWKKPAQPYGKWRKQYDYRCPTPRCGEIVIPYYYCAFNIIDWSIASTKIGDRETAGKRRLEANTIRRIQAGLTKFSQMPAIVDLAYAHGHDRRYLPLTMPFATQTTADSRGLVTPPFLLGQQSSAIAKPLTEPTPTISSAGTISLTTPPFVTPLDRAGDDSKHNQPLSEPLATQTSRQDKALVIPPFMIEHRNHSSGRSLYEMLATVTASGNHHGLVTPPFLTVYDSTDTGNPLTEPLATQRAFEHQALVTPFLASYYNGPSRDAVSPLSAPVPTITPEPRHTLVTPTPTVQVEDCGFRMLHWTEVREGMAFPSSYILKGNARQIVNQLGNAVTPPVIRWIIRRVFAVLN